MELRDTGRRATAARRRAELPGLPDARPRGAALPLSQRREPRGRAGVLPRAPRGIPADPREREREAGAGAGAGAAGGPVPALGLQGARVPQPGAGRHGVGVPPGGALRLGARARAVGEVAPDGMPPRDQAHERGDAAAVPPLPGPLVPDEIRVGVPGHARLAGGARVDADVWRGGIPWRAEAAEIHAHQHAGVYERVRLGMNE